MLQEVLSACSLLCSHLLIHYVPKRGYLSSVLRIPLNPLELPCSALRLPLVRGVLLSPLAPQKPHRRGGDSDFAPQAHLQQSTLELSSPLDQLADCGLLWAGVG